jgi:hypothetical protein
VHILGTYLCLVMTRDEMRCICTCCFLQILLLVSPLDKRGFVLIPHRLNSG